VPFSAQEWLTDAPEPVALSPKSQDQVSVSVATSVAAADRATEAPSVPVAGIDVDVMTGGALTTTTVAVWESVPPSPSVVVTTTDQVP
jgi:hypothetical protein